MRGGCPQALEVRLPLVIPWSHMALPVNVYTLGSRSILVDRLD